MNHKKMFFMIAKTIKMEDKKKLVEGQIEVS